MPSTLTQVPVFCRGMPERLTRRGKLHFLWNCVSVLSLLFGYVTPSVAQITTQANTTSLAGDQRPFPKPGVIFEYNQGIVMSDGLAIRANVFRPVSPGRYPVIVTHGPYGKDVAWQTAEPYKLAWQKVIAKVPSLCTDSSCKFMRWEMPDPERWVPAGYVVIHADSRGSGKTTGLLDVFGSRETQDYKELIEWAAVQPWSNGKIGLLGISYYATNQWQVAALQPKGLAAIIPWEGAVDAYRDIGYHGGIFSSTFASNWYKRQILPNQHGNSSGLLEDAVTGGSATGPSIPPELLASSRTSIFDDMAAYPLDGAYYRQRTPDLSRINVPTLSKGNWAGAGLHLRGNIEGFNGVAANDKWLHIHSGDHFSHFYLEAGFELQKSFFDQFLKGNLESFKKQPRVLVTVRDPVGGDKLRSGNTWPLEGTKFERWYLDLSSLTLERNNPTASVNATYEARSDGVTFKMPPSREIREFTGPLMARVWVSSSTLDADFFVTLRLLDPNGRDVTFEGANAPAVPVTQGWLRLSHRELDIAKSKPYRPVHTHRGRIEVEPNKPYPLDIEIWPTSIVVAPGYALALTIQGQDFAFPHIQSGIFRGSAPFLHNSGDPKVYGGKNTLYSGGSYESYLLLPTMTADRNQSGQ